VPDEVCAHFKDLGDYGYQPAREVAGADENTEVRSVIDVDILGHIFDQSINHLERLRLSLTQLNVGQGVSPAVRVDHLNHLFHRRTQFGINLRLELTHRQTLPKGERLFGCPFRVALCACKPWPHSYAGPS
jgi:hypothetical protein